MRALLVAGRALVGFYNDLFLLAGLSLLWWVTGGVFVAVAVVLGVPLYLTGPGNPWWLSPLVAIPAGPAIAALAVVARRSARDVRFDRGYYMDGFRTFWRPAIRLSAIGMIVLALLLLNVLFYASLENPLLRLIVVAWVYLTVVWLAVQMYAYPVLIAMEKPRALIALRTAALAALANPIFSAVLLLVAAVLAAFCTMLVLPLLAILPAMMALLGEHSLRLFLERAGLDPDRPSNTDQGEPNIRSG